MNLSALVKRPKRMSYGWWVVFGSAVLSFINSGMWQYGFGNFFKPLCNELGCSRADLSLAIALSRVEAGPESIVVGYVADRYGIRKILAVGAILWGIGFLLLSRINSLLGFYLVVCGVLALGSGICGHGLGHIAIVNWFRRKVGRAIGLQLVGLGLGGAAMTPLLGWLIVSYGWRVAAIACAILVWVVGYSIIPLMRHRPEKYGLLPDGDVPAEVGETTTTEVEGFTWREALKLPAFWQTACVFSMVFSVPGTLVIHQIPYLTDLGFSPLWAATAVGGVALVSIIGRVGFGTLGDYIDRRHVLAICMTGVAIGVLIFSFIQRAWQVYLYIAIFAPFYGGSTTTATAMRAEFFGRRNYGMIAGLQHLPQMVFALFFPWFAGYMFDVTGSYRVAFLTIVAAAIIGAIGILFIKRPTYPVRATT